jgi:hypothetical protein
VGGSEKMLVTLKFTCQDFLPFPDIENDVLQGDIEKIIWNGYSQKIFYKGKEAQVIEVKPVFTIMINSSSHVICGNVLNEVRPYVSES